MLTIAQNIEELRKILNGESISKVEALQFLDAIELNAISLGAKIFNLDSTINKNKVEISQLEDELETFTDNWIDGDNTKTVVTPLGEVLIYNKKGNLKLEDYIDEFEKKLLLV